MNFFADILILAIAVGMFIATLSMERDP